MKLLFVAIVSVLVLIAVIIYSDRVPPPPDFKTNQIKTTATKPIFNPEDVTQIKWALKSDFIEMDKVDGVWKIKSSRGFAGHTVDAWGAQRRLVALSRLAVLPDITVSQPTGEVTLVTPQDRIHGLYDENTFQWLSGPAAGKGIRFYPDLADLFNEGLAGFLPHTLEICEPEKVKSISFSDWSAQKEGGKWFIVQKDKKDPARPEAIRIISSSLCQIEADKFLNAQGPMREIFKIETNSRTFDFSKAENGIYSIPGFPNLSPEP